LEKESGLVYVKVHEVGGERIVAICDEELLGRTLYDSKRKLSFHISKQFYGGRIATIEEAIAEAMTATILNLVGKRIVSAAIENGLIHPDAVVEIAGTPHAQAVKIPW